MCVVIGDGIYSGYRRVLLIVIAPIRWQHLMQVFEVFVEITCCSTAVVFNWTSAEAKGSVGARSSGH